MASKRIQKDIRDLDVDLAHCECLLSRALKNKSEKVPVTKQPRPKSLATKCHHVVRSEWDHSGAVSTGPYAVDIVSSGNNISKGITPSKSRNGINYFEEILDGKNSVVSVTVKTKAGKDSNLKRTSSTQLTSTKRKTQENKSQNRDPPRKIDNNARLNNKVGEIPTKLNSRSDQMFENPEKPKHLTWGKRFQEQSSKVEVNKKVGRPENEPQQNMRSNAAIRNPSQLSRYTTTFAGGFNKPEEDKRCSSELSSISGSQKSYNKHMSDIDEILFMNQNMRSDQQSATSMRPVVSNMTNATAVSSFNSSGGDGIKDYSMINPVRLLNFLFKELDGKLESKETPQPDVTTRQLLREIELTLKRVSNDDGNHTTAKSSPIVIPNSPPVRDSNSQITNLHRHLEKTCSQAESAVIRVEQACEQLRKDKKQLEEDIAAKQKELDRALLNEKDYLRAVSSLKTSLEAMSMKCDEYAKTIASLTALGTELRDENKVIPALRAAQKKLNQRLEDSARENEALTTEVHLSRLEQEKLLTLVAERENELTRVRKEVTDIHQLVADQLESLKSSPRRQDERIGKLDREMGALNRHGWTSTSDSEGSVDEDQRLPVTSSPTSSCNSSIINKGVLPSWQKISNISSFDKNAIQNSIFREVGAAVETVLDGAQLAATVRSSSTPLDGAKANFQSLYLSMSDSTAVSTGPIVVSPTHKSNRQLKEDLDDLFAEIKRKTTGLKIKLTSPPRTGRGKEAAADNCGDPATYSKEISSGESLPVMNRVVRKTKRKP